MGYDSRVAAAMLSLGYMVFPFEAFNRTGQLKIPESVKFPSDVNTELSRVAANPLWAELFSTLSPLQGHHKCFMAGIGLMNDRIQVCVFKSSSTVGNPTEAQNWANSYHNTVEATLHAYAGKSHVIDPRWLPAIEKARSLLPAASQEVQVQSLATDFHLLDDDTPEATDDMEIVALLPWLSFGLSLLSDVVAKVTVRTKVLTTIVWYPPQKVRADENFAGNWKPIHRDLQTGWLSGHRSAHLIWNPVGTPVTWSGTEVKWKGPGYDMPHWPYQWCQALRPLASCVPSSIQGEDSLDINSGS